jgi:hypothetical protein
MFVNCSIIVALSLIEKIFEDANLPGISALRSFRLVRNKGNLRLKIGI